MKVRSMRRFKSILEKISCRIKEELLKKDRKMPHLLLILMKYSSEEVFPSKNHRKGK